MKLRRLQRKDAAGMQEWMGDPEIQKCFCRISNRTLEEVYRFIDQSANAIFQDGTDMHYAIADENDEYMGTISLKNINLTAKNAEYAIALRRRAQGTGMAYAATKELLRQAFDDYELERLYLNVLSDNRRAIGLYEKCGFVCEGEFRSHLYLHGELHSLKWYAMLRKEYMDMIKRNKI